MIAKSSNEAASRMFNRVGIDYISKVLQDPCYNLYDKKNGGGLWVGKPYGGGGTRVGDPIKGLSHAASVMQVCKYYYMLAFGQLVNEDRSKDMLQTVSYTHLDVYKRQIVALLATKDTISSVAGSLFASITCTGSIRLTDKSSPPQKPDGQKSIR